MLFLSLFIGMQLFAQTDFNKVKRVNLSNCDAIFSNEEVIGYYTFFYLDKENRNEDLYQLNIMDKNLKVTYSVELVISKRSWLLESKFNDERFCFSFINFKDKKIEYLFFDKQGKKVAEYKTPELSRTELSLMSQTMTSQDANYSGGLIGITGKGFVRYGLEKEDGWRMEMEMIDNNGKKLWSVNSNTKAKKAFESAMPVYANKDIVASLFGSREKLMSKDILYSILFHDVNTGKELFRTEPLTNGKKLLPIGVSFEVTSKEYIIYGEYYDQEDNMKDNSKGYFFQSYTLTGTKKKEVFVGWANDLAKVFPQSKEGKPNNDFYISLHNMIRTSNGKFYGIGEEFNKAVSAFGVASTLLSQGNGGTAVMKIVLHNMVVFEFDQNFKVINIKEIEKEKTNVQLPQGLGALSTPMLGFYLRAYGEFDYEYSSLSKDQKTFTAAYVNYDREKGASNNYVIGTIGVGKDGKLGTDKIRLSDKPTKFIVMPSKPGYVAVLKYYAKEKKISWVLEKTNY